MLFKISFFFGKHLAPTFLLLLSDVMFMWMVRAGGHVLCSTKYLTLIRSIL